MTEHEITIEIDDTKLASYTDGYLAVCWHAAQHNPAPYGDTSPASSPSTSAVRSSVAG